MANVGQMWHNGEAGAFRVSKPKMEVIDTLRFYSYKMEDIDSSNQEKSFIRFKVIYKFIKLQEFIFV